MSFSYPVCKLQSTSKPIANEVPFCSKLLLFSTCNLSLPSPFDILAAITSWWVSSLYFFLCFFLLLITVQSNEPQILLNLKAALQTSNIDAFHLWNSTNFVCNFHGITCNSDGSVNEIELSNHNISRILPFDSICQLHSLETLSFGFNALHGIVSEDLNNCVKLRYLDLGNNIFLGPFPDISPFSQLQYLYLNLSGFSRTFPWKSLLNMTSLLQLSVRRNLFALIMFPTEVVNLKNLNWLYLSSCTLKGKIPAGVGNLTKLRDLEFSNNFISSEISMEIGKLRNLWQLEFNNNSFTRKIPIGFQNLTGLENFDGSMNMLEGNLSELSFLRNTVSLQLFENNLSGQFPEEKQRDRHL